VKLVFLDPVGGAELIAAAGARREPLLPGFAQIGGTMEAFLLDEGAAEVFEMLAEEQGIEVHFAPPPARSLPELIDAPWDPTVEIELQFTARVISAFLDAIGTATGRATFYNTRQAQEAAERRAHARAFAVDRGLYAGLLTLPGCLDRARVQGILRLLSVPRTPSGPTESGLFPIVRENALIRRMLRDLPVPRQLRLFGELRRRRVNNSRTRTLILRTILRSRRLELWSVRYRRKLRSALFHAWSRRTASILARVLARPEEQRTPSEAALVSRCIHRWCREGTTADVEDCAAFVLGVKRPRSLRMLRAYDNAKTRLEAGRRLPWETLEGLRSTYHPARDSADVLSMTRTTLTSGQQIRLQRAAKAAGVKVAFDPSRADPVRLYVYAFAEGWTREIGQALDDKAAAVVDSLPAKLGWIGVILDASGSMSGADEQALRPMAAALAVRDLLVAAADRASVVVAGGEQIKRTGGRLIRPAGDTALAEHLVALLRQRPEAIFVLSDGYENAPAGRFAETMTAVRALGIRTPVYQISPVMAAEVGGLRALDPGRTPVLPVGRPEGLGVALLKGMLLAEPALGLETLMRRTLLKERPPAKTLASAEESGPEEGGEAEEEAP